MRANNGWSLVAQPKGVDFPGVNDPFLSLHAAATAVTTVAVAVKAPKHSSVFEIAVRDFHLGDYKCVQVVRVAGPLAIE